MVERGRGSERSKNPATAQQSKLSLRRTYVYITENLVPNFTKLCDLGFLDCVFTARLIGNTQILE